MAEIVPVSVTQALLIAKEKLSSFRLKVIGEVSSVTDTGRYAAVYFSIADDEGVLKCLMWRSQYEAQTVKLKEGMLVELTGKFSVFPKRGDLQFEVSVIEEAGQGDLKAQVARRLEKLRAEGLTDDSRKRPLPECPNKIALITSGQGKAVHDVIKTLRRRYPVAEVLFFGVRVEGVGASEIISDAIARAAQTDADVILLVRGGGSYEDLLPFSEENVARAIAASTIPLVTGIGHEPDVSIADYIADRAAPTPTAAAELVSPDVLEINATLKVKKQRLGSALSARLKYAKAELARLSSRQIIKSPQSLLIERAQTIDSLSQRLERAIPDNLNRDKVKLMQLKTRFVHSHELGLERSKRQLSSNAAKLDALSPLKVLGRGYSALFDETNKRVISSIEQIAVSDLLKIKLKDGEASARVEEIG